MVEEIVNTRPYTVANFQILLDKEELHWEEGGDNDKIMSKTSSIEARKRSGIRDVRSKCKFLRGAAVTILFQKIRRISPGKLGNQWQLSQRMQPTVTTE